MTEICNRLGYAGFKVVWTPSPNVNNHGQIDLPNRTIHIFDIDEKDAWITLVHELLELKLRPVLSYYRSLVNILIEFIEKQAYQNKEKFLECLPEAVSTLLNEMEKAKKYE